MKNKLFEQNIFFFLKFVTHFFEGLRSKSIFKKIFTIKPRISRLKTVFWTHYRKFDIGRCRGRRRRPDPLKSA